jgi:predicted enzyme related to lactoylglutathione lyase
VLGWTHRTTDVPGGPPYTEFDLGGDVDSSFGSAIGAGAREMLAPQDFPGGRFAIVSDPQGAIFGLLTMAPR